MLALTGSMSEHMALALGSGGKLALIVGGRTGPQGGRRVRSGVVRLIKEAVAILAHGDRFQAGRRRRSEGRRGQSEGRRHPMTDLRQSSVVRGITTGAVARGARAQQRGTICD